MKNVVSIIVIILNSGLSLAAQVNLDSLWMVWNDKNQPDTVRLKAIADFTIDGYLYSQADSAYYFAQLQYDYAKSQGLKKQMAGALNLQGASFWVRGNYSSAIDHYNRNLTIRKEIGDRKGIANSLNNIGVIYKTQGNYRMAIEYYTQSLTTITELGDKNGIAKTLNNIGNIYGAQGDNANSIDYYNQSLTIKEDIGDKKGVATSLANIGIVYSVLNDYNTALDFQTRSLMIMEEIGDKYGVAECLDNIGIIYSQQNDYSKAINYLTLSLTIREEIGDKHGIAECTNNLGLIYNKLGDYNNSIRHNIEALKMARELGATVLIKEAAQTLHKSYKSAGKFFNALEMHELYMNMRDSLLSKNNQREIIRQEFKYAYEKQTIADSLKNMQAIHVQEVLVALEIDKNKKNQQQTKILYGGIILLISLLILLFNRFNVATHRKKIIELQKLKVEASNSKLIEKNHEIQYQADTINKINKEIKHINESLEVKVQNRTKKIELQNVRLRKYAFANAHEVRAPLSRLLGLINLWDKESMTETDQDFIIENISVSTIELDKIIKKVSDLLNEEENDQI